MTGVEVKTDIQPEAQETANKSALRNTLLLVLVTMIWGSTFLVVKDTVKISGPFTFLAFSCSVGTLVLAIIFRKRLLHITRAEVFAGLLIGIFLFAGYALQTTGLQYTTVSKAGFLTGLYVPQVPLLSFLLLRQRPTFGAIIGVVCSLIGLILLSVNSTFNLVFGLGEVLLLGCSVAFALQIICISRFAPRVDAINLAIIQLALTAVLSFLAMPIMGETYRIPPLVVWGAVLFMGVADIAFCLLIMNWVQQYVSSNRATLIYALEPMWAALFGYVLAGETLSLFAWIGCIFILLGMIVGGIRLSSFKTRKRQSTTDNG
nr:DMT family transporter [Ktedonobacteraceae bacterium]